MTAVRTLIQRILLIFAFCAATTPLHAQAPTGTPMELHPFEIDSLGMTIRLPEGSAIDIRRIAGGESLVIVSDPANPYWSIRLQNYIVREPDMTTVSILDEIIRSRQQKWRAQVVDQPDLALTRARFFRRTDNLLIGGNRQASRVYTDVPNEPQIETVGFTVIRHDSIRIDESQARVGGMPQFVVCELHVLQEVEQAINLYETVLATIQFRDPGEMKAERYAAIQLGQGLLESLNTDDLLNVLDPEPRFFRLYRPDDGALTGDAGEVGWKRVEIARGQRGELDPDRPRSQWREADLEDGFIAREEARVVVNNITFDTRGIYFLSADRQREVWSIINVAESGGRSDHSTLTLIKDENGVTVTTVAPGRPPDETKYRTLPSGYLSRVELYLLPRLIADRKVPGVFGFYTYDPTVETITYRQEDFSFEGTHWVQMTTPTANTRPMKTTLGREGNIIHKDVGTGTWMEPSTREQIRKIWELRDRR